MNLHSIYCLNQTRVLISNIISFYNIHYYSYVAHSRLAKDRCLFTKVRPHSNSYNTCTNMSMLIQMVKQKRHTHLFINISKLVCKGHKCTVYILHTCTGTYTDTCYNKIVSTQYVQIFEWNHVYIDL